MLKNSIGNIVRNALVPPKKGRSKYRIVGTRNVAHAYPQRYGSPLYKNVVIKRAERIDNSRYTGAKLRKLRRDRGVGVNKVLKFKQQMEKNNV